MHVCAHTYTKKPTHTPHPQHTYISYWHIHTNGQAHMHKGLYGHIHIISIGSLTHPFRHADWWRNQNTYKVLLSSASVQIVCWLWPTLCCLFLISQFLERGFLFNTAVKQSLLQGLETVWWRPCLQTSNYFVKNIINILKTIVRGYKVCSTDQTEAPFYQHLHIIVA